MQGSSIIEAIKLFPLFGSVFSVSGRESSAIAWLMELLYYTCVKPAMEKLLWDDVDRLGGWC